MSEEKGFFTVSRKLVDNWIYPANQNRKFTEFEAWLEIIRMAKFVCTKKLIQGKLIIIPRGYFDTTVTQLSSVFHWDKRTVEKFLQLLETDGMIKRFKLNPKSLKSCTLIKVNNYNKQQPEIWEQCKSEYKTKCVLNCCPKDKRVEQQKSSKNPEERRKNFVKPTIDEVKAYCEERKNGINAEAFIDFYDSKGWLIGKTKMKDWKAAVRTWEAKRDTKKFKSTATQQQTKQSDDFYMSLSR